MKEKIAKKQFIKICMAKAEQITRKEFNLGELTAMSSHHWTFRNGAMAMCTELLKEQYDVQED